MSWMDSWSRPSKSQATPAPFYLLPGGESTTYCHSCARVVGARKTTAAAIANANTPAKYCSSRCRNQKPGKLDREIERVFVSYLTGQDGAVQGNRGKGGPGGQKKAKGDPRILVACSIVEDAVFGHDNTHIQSGCSDPLELEEIEAVGTQVPRDDPPPDDVVAGHINSAQVDGDVLARMSVRSGTRIRPPQSVSEVNGSVGGEKGKAERIEETDEMLEKRRQGQKRARQREMVRCAARRGVAFGFVGEERRANADGEKTADLGKKRLCEAVMAGKVVEPSFAKGDWSVRWREEYN